MKIATIANVRVSNEARETKDLGMTLKVAFRGGSVMGLCVAGFGLAGLLIVYLLFGVWLRQANPESIIVVENWLGIFIHSVHDVDYRILAGVVRLLPCLTGRWWYLYQSSRYGCRSSLEKRKRIYPEDDPRNPATIAETTSGDKCRRCGWPWQ